MKQFPNGLAVITVRSLRMAGIPLRQLQLDEPGLLNRLLMIALPKGPRTIAMEARYGPKKPWGGNARRAEREIEFLKVRGRARTTHGDTRTSHEEFRSARGRFHPRTEEFQSVNRELIIFRENMRFPNAEFQSLNAGRQPSGRVERKNQRVFRKTKFRRSGVEPRLSTARPCTWLRLHALFP